MKTTADFLDDLQKKLGFSSDNALGLKLGIRRQTMSEYRTLKTTFNDDTSLKIAALLEIDPAYIIASMHYQREKNSELRAIWQHIASLSIGAAAVALVFVALPFGALPYGDAGIFAASTGADNGQVCILCKTAFWSYWPFLALFAALVLGLPRNNSPRQ